MACHGCHSDSRPGDKVTFHGDLRDRAALVEVTYRHRDGKVCTWLERDDRPVTA
jgi:hypothetical protein